MARARTVAGGAGFAGDRIEPAVELAASGLVDDIGLECLAERTIVFGLRTRRTEPRSGYDPRLRARFTPLLPVLAESGCRVVTNLGAANPQAAAEELAKLAGELGLRRPRVAAVLGDDLGDRVGEVHWADVPEGAQWLGAHAYIGSEGIAAALAAGAQIVVTGRAADSALFVGPLRELLDGSEEALAGALVVGHLLECSGQLTGGNYQAPGGERLTPAELARLGFPLARVDASGQAELALLPGAPGRLDRLTCTLQLLYEVHDPAAYVTPDGIVDMSGVGFEQLGENRVRVSGATLRGRPEQLKVSGFVALPGAIADVEIGYAGPGALDRAREAAEVMRLRLELAGLAAGAAIDLVGVDSLLGPASAPLLAPPPEVRMHATVACPDLDAARLVEDELFGLTLSGPPHGGGMRVERREHVAVLDGRIDRAAVREEVVWA